jgi:acyl-CoA synthetase (NDP forming)
VSASAATATSDELRGALAPLLEPRSIAIVGASERQGAHRAIIENARRGGVPVYPVNPTRTEVFGLHCHPAVGELPVVPDLVLLAVGHRRVEDAFDEAVAAGCGTFVLPDLGSEAGHEGPAVAEAVVEQRQFDEIAASLGLKAALAWRDSRYGEELGSTT